MLRDKMINCNTNVEYYELNFVNSWPTVSIEDNIPGADIKMWSDFNIIPLGTVQCRASRSMLHNLNVLLSVVWPCLVRSQLSSLSSILHLASTTCDTMARSQKCTILAINGDQM